MDNADDYYAVLGVSRGAEDVVIRAAYKALAQRYHPDKAPGSETRMQAINTAYGVLSDPVQRAQYDAQQRHSFSPASQPTPLNVQPTVVQIDAASLTHALWFGLQGAVQGGLLFGVVFGVLFAVLGALGSRWVLGLILGLALIRSAKRQQWNGLVPTALLALLLAWLAGALGSAANGAFWGVVGGGVVGALVFGLVSAITRAFHTALTQAVRQRR